MGILDHRKQWEFTLNAPPQRCVQSFMAVFNGTRGGGPLIARAKWTLRQTPKGAVAVYRGRGGVMGFLTLLTERGSNEQASAVGSEIAFETRAGDNNTTVCRMWLSLSGSSMGFTSDARFLRPYMRRVEDSLRQVDPHIAVRRS